MKTSLILNATDSNQKKVQKTFTDVNADCHPSKLKQFAQKLNAFTNNTYEGATRIDKTDIDTAEDKGTMSPTFRWRHQVGDTSYETITSAEYDINGTKLSDQKQIPVQLVPPQGNTSIPLVTPQTTIKNLAWTLYGDHSLGWTVVVPADSTSVTFNIDIPESDNFYRWTQSYTLNVVGGE